MAPFVRSNRVGGPRAKFAAIWPWGAFLCSSALIFYGLYAFWSAVGAREIEGVQGRYFLPIFPLLALGVAPFLGDAVLRSGVTERVRGGLALVFCAFPLLSYFEIIAVVMRRFYIG